jgi:hypothetical protein
MQYESPTDLASWQQGVDRPQFVLTREKRHFTTPPRIATSAAIGVTSKVDARDYAFLGVRWTPANTTLVLKSAAFASGLPKGARDGGDNRT